jgi:hypothetical protein
MLKFACLVLGMLIIPIVQGQMTYEGRISPNESRAWLYGSISVFLILILFVYNIEKISPIVKNLIRKFIHLK